MAKNGPTRQRLIGSLCCVLLAVARASAGPSQVYRHGDPTDSEQYLLELVNRARLDPAGEAALFGIDLNEGLAAGTLGTEPRQPLALNPQLLASARGHSRPWW